MARIIPLNRFRSLFASGLKADGLYDLYTAPNQRSATVVLAQCANTTNEARTVTFGVSSKENNIFYHLVKNFEIPPNDARNLLTGRLILQGFDGDTILSPEILYIKDLTPLTSPEVVLINSFSNFANIIENPTNFPKTQPGGDISDTTFLSAADLIARYRSDIQLDTIRYVKSTSSALDDGLEGPMSLSGKCFRDSGYIVDSIIADLRNNANHRCIETGIFYFSGYMTATFSPLTGTTVPTLPANQVQATIAAISAIGAFITGIDIPSDGGFTTVFPDGILSAGSGGESKTTNVIDLVRTVYHPLSTGGDTYSYSPSGEPSFPDKELAASLLENKAKIQKIVKDYVFNQGYLADQDLRDKCNRDVGFMVDAVANDLSTGVMAKSIQYALSYWSGAVVGATSRIPSNNPRALDQEKNTIDTIQFLKKTALNINAPLSGGLSISLGILETKY
jgi:hypothetical protein